MSTFQLPSPPAGSILVVENDQQGRPRLRWPLPEAEGCNHWSDIGCSALLLLGLGFAVVMTVLGLLSSDGKNLLGAVCCVGVALLPAFGLLPKVLISFRSPRPARLTFGQHEMLLDPGRSRTFREKGMFADWLTLISDGPPPRRLTLEKMEQLRIDRLGVRQRLTIDVGAERVEIGASLTEPEREWLAEVIVAWKKQM
jgi:hypothetical protein